MRTLPPAFLGMRRGYPWGSEIPPLDLAVEIGQRQIALNAEQFQRWQCRLGEWDFEVKFVDTIGGGPTFERDYGDPPPPVDDFPTWQSRELVAMAASKGQQFPVGINFIEVQTSVNMGAALSDAAEENFYPAVSLSGNTLASGSGFGTLIIDFNCVKNSSDWEEFFVATVEDGSGVSYPVQIWREPFPPGFTPTEFWEIDTLGMKPTRYVDS